MIFRSTTNWTQGVYNDVRPFVRHCVSEKGKRWRSMAVPGENSLIQASYSGEEVDANRGIGTCSP